MSKETAQQEPFNIPQDATHVSRTQPASLSTLRLPMELITQVIDLVLKSALYDYIDRETVFFEEIRYRRRPNTFEEIQTTIKEPAYHWTVLKLISISHDAREHVLKLLKPQMDQTLATFVDQSEAYISHRADGLCLKNFVELERFGGVCKKCRVMERRVERAAIAKEGVAKTIWILIQAAKRTRSRPKAASDKKVLGVL